MKQLLVVLVAMASVLVTTRPVEACSCAVMDAAGALSSADAVFEGTLVRLEQLQNGTVGRATFRVTSVWKGSVSREVVVQVPGARSMCPPHFSEDSQGSTFIIYASSASGGLQVTACARYASGNLAGERRALGAPTRRYRRHVPPPG